MPKSPHAVISSRANGLNFGLSLHLNFVYASSEGCGEPAYLCRSPEPSLLDNAVSNKVSCACTYVMGT